MRALPREIEANLQFSGHETFPLRQLWLRKAHSAVAELPVDQRNGVFADDDAISRFGVGKNMVASIRHWALACEIIQEVRGEGYSIAPIGEHLFGPDGLDPFLERPATTWLVHWMLAGRALRSTTWFWVFNALSQQTFDRDTILAGLLQFASDKQIRVATNTLKRDIEVCVRCYVPRISAENPEDVAEPLLGELGLIGLVGKNAFEFRRGPKHTLPDGIFAFAVLDFWRRWESETGSSQATMSFEAIAHDYGSPGRVFKLDENSIADRLIALEELTKGRLQWTDSGGIRQLVRAESGFTANLQGKLLKAAYV